MSYDIYWNVLERGHCEVHPRRRIAELESELAEAQAELDDFKQTVFAISVQSSLQRQTEMLMDLCKRHNLTLTDALKG